MERPGKGGRLRGGGAESSPLRAGGCVRFQMMSQFRGFQSFQHWGILDSTLWIHEPLWKLQCCSLPSSPFSITSSPKPWPPRLYLPLVPELGTWWGLASHSLSRLPSELFFSGLWEPACVHRKRECMEINPYRGKWSPKMANNSTELWYHCLRFLTSHIGIQQHHPLGYSSYVTQCIPFVLCPASHF